MKHRLNNRRKFVIAILTMGVLASACSDPTIIGSSADTIDDQEFYDSDQSDESTTSESTPSVSADEIIWSKCKADPQGESQCGELAVPFDYQDPSLGSFTLFLTRKPAADQANKVGSMLVNPGGPGFGGSSVAADAEYYFSDELLDRFDIIGWDPRGTGKSTPAVDCVDEYDDYFGIDSTPESPEEKQAIIDAGAVRTTPILLTTGAVVIGASIILFDPIFQGLAISLVAGAIVSTILTLIVVPLLYYMTEKHKYEK